LWWAFWYWPALFSRSFGETSRVIVFVEGEGLSMRITHLIGALAVVLALVFSMLVYVRTMDLNENALKEHTDQHTEYMPKGVGHWEYHEPNRWEYGTELLDTCAWLRWKGSHAMWIPEGQALLKEKRLGSAGLDEDDKKWVMGAVYREAACTSLLKRHNLLGPVGAVARFVYVCFVRQPSPDYSCW
jgi:hypothetical protein